MDQTPKQPRSISEISHLFLSSVRTRQTGGGPARGRPPPKNGGQSAVGSGQSDLPSSQPTPSIDLTPEEYAHVFAGAEPTGQDSADVRIPPVTAIIAQHLNGRANERVTDYARHLAANGERVGVLEIDAGEVRLRCFERSIEPNDGDPSGAEVSDQFDGRFINESLEEMSWDLDRWLLVLPNLRSTEARQLLKQVDHWTLLSTCDHDGVVSCYRTLKGLANLHNPRMTLALMETASETQAAKVHRKLCSVCLQFLGIELLAEPAVRPTEAVAEHVVAHCRLTRDPAQLTTAAQRLGVSGFLAEAGREETRDEDSGLREAGEKPAAAGEVRSEISDLKSEMTAKEEIA